MKPNLFNYATSELSQDAFICWLLDWANSRNHEYDKNLNLLAQKFVDILLEKKLINYHIEIKKQSNNIDIYAIVNDTYFIVIEDKKGTSEHSNQLIKYSKFVSENKEWSHLTVKLVYFKMEEQSGFSQINEAKYTHFDREKMLKVLSTYFDSVPENYQNHILKDFYNDLIRLDIETKSFQNLPVTDWTYRSWVGFFHNLQESLKEFNPNWNYVPNASGGFLGFFWSEIMPSENTPTFYLQIEQTGLLTFRLKSDDIELNRKFRIILINQLELTAEKFQIKLSNYGGRGKIGKSMGVLKLNDTFMKIKNNGSIDFLGTVDFLKIITKILQESVEKMTFHLH